MMRRFKSLAKKASHPDLTAYALSSIRKRKNFKSNLPKNFTRCKIPHDPQTYTKEGLIQRIVNNEWLQSPELFCYIEAIYQHDIALIALDFDRQCTSVTGDIILKWVRCIFKKAVRNYSNVVVLNPNFRTYVVNYIKCEVAEEVAYYFNLDQEENFQKPEPEPVTETQPIPTHLEVNYA